MNFPAADEPIQPEQYPDPIRFTEARTASWERIAAHFDPNGALLEAFKQAWITEWFAWHGPRIRLAIRATIGLQDGELEAAADRGGLRQCIDDNRAFQKQVDALADHEAANERLTVEVEGLRAVLERIATYRRQNARLPPGAIVETMSLMALEALTYGPDALALGAEESTTEPAALKTEADFGESIVPPAPAHIPGAAPIPPGLPVLTAAKFASMAGIRSLTKADGKAHPSDGQTYDPGRLIDPAMPVVGSFTHVVWIEFGALQA